MPAARTLLARSAVVAALAAVAPAFADDKHAFTLFNPTPRELMREMSTDRPDTTESPYTVDAGHVQVELSLFDYSREHNNGSDTITYSILPMNFKVGLMNNVDVQFVFTPYTHEKTKSGGDSDTVDGFSDDTQIRLKINLWGNDGGAGGVDTAFALMPFVKFPTGSGELSNDHVEGGLIMPLAISLPREFSLGLMAEIDAVYNDESSDYGFDFVHTATLSHEIPTVPNLGGYVEYIGIAPHDTGGTYQAIASAGLTYAVTDDWMVDCGGTAGISDSADDFSFFVGTSFRH